MVRVVCNSAVIHNTPCFPQKFPFLLDAVTPLAIQGDQLRRAHEAPFLRWPQQIDRQVAHAGAVFVTAAPELCHEGGAVNVVQVGPRPIQIPNARAPS